jgi:hypothetical protein
MITFSDLQYILKSQNIGNRNIYVSMLECDSFEIILVCGPFSVMLIVSLIKFTLE